LHQGLHRRRGNRQRRPPGDVRDRAPVTLARRPRPARQVAAGAATRSGRGESGNAVKEAIHPRLTGPVDTLPRVALIKSGVVGLPALAPAEAVSVLTSPEPRVPGSAQFGRHPDRPSDRPEPTERSRQKDLQRAAVGNAEGESQPSVGRGR
jgi:hypothetical protein